MQTEKIGKSAQVRRSRTQRRIYRYLYHSKTIRSKQMIADDLGLSMPTVFNNLELLIQDGLVRYSGEFRSTGGRRAQGVEIVAAARCSAGISLDGALAHFSLIDLRQREIAHMEESCPLTGGINLPQYLAEALERFLSDFLPQGSQLLGVGIAVPHSSAEAPQVPDLGCRFPYPTYLASDAECAIAADPLSLDKNGVSAYLILGKQVDGAIRIRGESGRPARIRHGAFGKICVEPSGLPCVCGRRGCLNAYCSSERITNEIGVSVADFFAATGHHIAQCELLLDDFLRHLAVGVRNISMTLCCDVTLGGELAPYLSDYMPRLRAYLNEYCKSGYDAARVHLRSGVQNDIALGAAYHFVEQFIETE